MGCSKMEENIKYEFSVKEFFNLLNEKLFEIKKINYKLNDTYDLYNTCCNYNANLDTYVCSKAKIENLLKNKKGKKDFKNLLIKVFGEHFFDYSKEEQENMKKQGIATKESLNSIFFNTLIKIPDNYDEFTNTIESIINDINNDEIGLKRSSYTKILVIIENIIATRYKSFLEAYNNQEFVINKLSEIISLYKNKKEIKKDNDMDLFINLLNQNIDYEIILNDNSTTNSKLGFGDLTYDVIKRYNDELKRLRKEKQVKEKINKYYKDLTKTPLDIMRNDQFPSYDEAHVEKIYEGLIDKIGEFTDKHNKFCELLAITQVQYLNYFQSDYYHDANKKIRRK